jgi:transposase
MLVQCAWAAKRAKNSYYRAQFFRLQTRRGPQKAICAVAASILTAIYHILKDGVPHQDLGSDYFDRRKPEAKVKRLVNQIRQARLRSDPATPREGGLNPKGELS